MKKLNLGLLLAVFLVGCGKSNEQPASTQSSGDQQQVTQQSQKSPSDDPRNLATQMNSDEQLRESRYAMQVAAKSMSDADWFVFEKVASESNVGERMMANSIPTGLNGPVNPDHPSNEISQDELQKWFSLLPPSQQNPISTQLKNASPATSLQVLTTAFNNRWKDMANRFTTNQVFCRIADNFGQIGFDGKFYSFPVGVFNISSETAISLNGKYLNKTPANLVSDAEYNKINSLVSNQENGIRICWKGEKGFVLSPEVERRIRNSGGLPEYVHTIYHAELVGTYDIIDKRNGSTIYSFPNNWFFY